MRDFLARHGLAAHRDRGQNFLHDARLAAKLAARAGVTRGDTVIEIGTGLGILTRALAERGARVVTIEVDAGLVRALRAEPEALPRGATLLHADAREVDLAARAAEAPGPVRVVANLPYAVATPILRALLDLPDRLAPLESWSVLLQREVAERLGARPGSRDYGSLAVLHALVARVERGLDLHPRCFYPVPSVVSTFVHVTPREDAPGRAELARIERVARAGFGQRRKTLANALRAGLGLEAERIREALVDQGLPETVRAEAVPPPAWRVLAAGLARPRGRPGRRAGRRGGGAARAGRGPAAMSPEPRRDFPVPVPVDLTASQGEVREESAVNLSPGGVCLHVRTPLAEGDRVHLRLEVPPEGPLLEAPGQVVWTSRDTAPDGDPDDASGHWEVGVRLETEALAEEVRRRVRDWASQPTGRRR